MNKLKKTRKKSLKRRLPEQIIPVQLPVNYLIHHLNSPITIFDYRINEFIYVNQPFADLTGFTRDDLNSIMFNWFSRIHPQDLHIWKDKIQPRINKVSKRYIKSSRQQLTADICFRFKGKDGKIIHFLTQSSVIEWKGNQRAVVLNMFTDISQYKRDAKMSLEIKVFDDAVSEWKVVYTEEFLSEPEMLTKREAEILRLMADGSGVGEISKMHGLNYYTVRAHWRNILAKTKCKSHSELIELAHAEGWI